MRPLILTLGVVLALCLVAHVGLCAAAPSEAQAAAAFKDFVTTHGKQYSTEEFQRRYAIFKSNLNRIEELNKKGSRATFGVNKFADLTREEFKRTYLGVNTPSPRDAPVAPLVSKKTIDTLPKSCDWREKGAVTHVKDQGACGSCWSFSTTGNVEGQWFLAGHNLTALSEQNLVDCDHECSMYDNEKSCDAGCNGGLMVNAYNYIIKNGGIDTEQSYPYEGYDGQCRYKNSSRGATIRSYTMVSSDEDQMAAYLVAHGPLAIAAEADEWQFYLFGVFDLPCGTTLDHGILIVGYGEEVDIFGYNIQYWIVKNSWGAGWGESGYLRIIKGYGECGLNQYVSSSIV